VKFYLVGEYLKEKKKKTMIIHSMVHILIGGMFYTFHIHGLMVMKFGMINRRQMNSFIHELISSSNLQIDDRIN
jgi:hypothetical protein